MIPEKLFQQLLVLGDGWRVRAVDYVEPQSKVVIRIEETPQLWGSQKCPHCEAAAVMTMRRSGVGGTSMSASWSRRLHAPCREGSAESAGRCLRCGHRGRGGVVG
jgi:hypothetical protein